MRNFPAGTSQPKSQKTSFFSPSTNRGWDSFHDSIWIFNVSPYLARGEKKPPFLPVTFSTLDDIQDQKQASAGRAGRMQLPERGRARRGAARTFPFGIPVWDARRQWRGGDTPFEERKEPVRRGQSPRGRDRALGPHSKEVVPSNAPAWSISRRDGTGSSQAPGHKSPDWHIRPKRSLWSPARPGSAKGGVVRPWVRRVPH